MKVADMHCDTISIILKSKQVTEETKNNKDLDIICDQDIILQSPINLKKNNLHLDIEKMKAGDYLL